MQNSLVVRPDSSVIGLASQKLRHRKPAPQGETRTERLKRDRESLIWGQAVEQVGPPIPKATWINVCDRGADNFEFYWRVIQQSHDWVVRAKQLQRCIEHEDAYLPLEEKLAAIPLNNQYHELEYHGKSGTRTAIMRVRFDAITIRAPKLRSP